MQLTGEKEPDRDTDVAIMNRSPTSQLSNVHCMFKLISEIQDLSNINNYETKELKHATVTAAAVLMLITSAPIKDSNIYIAETAFQRETWCPRDAGGSPTRFK